MHFHFDLIFEATLLDHKFWKTDTSAISDSDQGCFHNYNVITLVVPVNTVLRTLNEVVSDVEVGVPPTRWAKIETALWPYVVTTQVIRLKTEG